MSSTKIINVLKDDGFEELLGIIRETDASEVIFVLPKKTKAFRSEAQFAALEDESKKINKTITFLCSNPEISELARKYNFSVLSARGENSKLKPTRSKPAGQVVVPVVAMDDDPEIDEPADEDEEDDYAEEEPDKKNIGGSFEESEDEDEKDYKEDGTEPESAEEEPPFGTKLDDEGNTIYDEEEEEEKDELIASRGQTDDFQIITASAKTRGMSDVIRPNTGRNLKIAQKDRGTVKIEARKQDDDEIRRVWGGSSSSDIWSGISKPRIQTKGSKYSFFNIFKSSSRNKKSSEPGPMGISKELIGILSVILIVMLAFVVYLVTGNAKIEIKPKAQKLNTQLKVSVSPDFSSIDESLNQIPGQLFDIKKSASGEFNATAEKDAIQKSRGTITIYNEYSTSPQPLVATTRFEFQTGENKGLVFRTLQTVTVPGMKVENGVVTPGKINVGVIADKAGQDYNVPAGNFGIVSWREKSDDARYQKIYGKSSEAMHGGIMGKAKVVSEFDYNNAQDQLVAKVKKDVAETLKSQSAGLELIASIEPKIDSIEDTAKIDDAADMFSMTINGSITTVGFRKDDLLSLVSGYIDRTNGWMVVPEKLELSYKDAAVNPADGILKITVEIKGSAYAKIDQDQILSNLAGKNKVQIKSYLNSIKEIDSAKVIFSPFWVKNVPRNKDKIKISLVFI